MLEIQEEMGIKSSESEVTMTRSLRNPNLQSSILQKKQRIQHAEFPTRPTEDQEQPQLNLSRRGWIPIVMKEFF